MPKLTNEYKVQKYTDLIAKLEYAIDNMQYKLKDKKARLKEYAKKVKLIEKAISAAAPKVVSIKRGRKKAVA